MSCSRAFSIYGTSVKEEEWRILLGIPQPFFVPDSLMQSKISIYPHYRQIPCIHW